MLSMHQATARLVTMEKESGSRSIGDRLGKATEPPVGAASQSDDEIDQPVVLRI